MAATDFHVNGPTVIGWKVAGSEGSFSSLGYTDNDDLVRITATDHKRTYTRNDGGDMIAEAVYSGTTGTLDLTLVSWDEAALSGLISHCRTGTATAGVAAQGSIATVGGPILGTAGNLRTVSIQINPTNAGADVYEFPRLMLNTGPEYIDLGNAVKRVSLSFTSVWTTTQTAFVAISNKA